MTNTLTQRITYERLKNGMDVYILPTNAEDIVTCMLAFPGGIFATYDRQSLALLVGELMPGSTKKRVRSKLLERFDELGAQVGIHEENEHLVATLAARKEAFPAAFELLMETLTDPVFEKRELDEARSRISTQLRNAFEDTGMRARLAITESLFRKGHPHWSPNPKSIAAELARITTRDVSNFYADTFSASGALGVFAGAVVPHTLAPLVAKLLGRVPKQAPKRVANVSVARTNAVTTRDVILPIQDKMNVDTLLAIPTTLTREHEDFHALGLGVHILGGSATARLFHILRNKMSLTYDARARLIGFEDGYPGYLRAQAIFPNDVFAKGRAALRTVVQAFVEQGVSAQELSIRKVELAGRHKVGLSTTSGLAGALFATLLSGRRPEYLDDYPRIIESLTLKEVNNAIHTHLDYSLAVSAAAGAVDMDGKVLA